MPQKRCVICGDKYPESSIYPACTQACAARLATMLVAMMELQGQDFRQLLPEKTESWGPRPDTIPWDLWRAARTSAERLGESRKPRWGD